jgi:hypothetical protein
MNGAPSGMAVSFPPFGGEVGIRGIPASLAHPHKGGGNSPACATVFAINSSGVRA